MAALLVRSVAKAWRHHRRAQARHQATASSLSLSAQPWATPVPGPGKPGVQAPWSQGQPGPDGGDSRRSSSVTSAGDALIDAELDELLELDTQVC